jgi:hypothetical protein
MLAIGFRYLGIHVKPILYAFGPIFFDVGCRIVFLVFAGSQSGIERLFRRY